VVPSSSDLVNVIGDIAGLVPVPRPHAEASRVPTNGRDEPYAKRGER